MTTATKPVVDQALQIGPAARHRGVSLRYVRGDQTDPLTRRAMDVARMLERIARQDDASTAVTAALSGLLLFAHSIGQANPEAYRIVSDGLHVVIECLQQPEVIVVQAEGRA